MYNVTDSHHDVMYIVPESDHNDMYTATEWPQRYVHCYW
jgi:hypothetical protein